LAGIKTSAPLRLNPTTFNISGLLIMPVPGSACDTITNNVSGKIVFTVIDTKCTPGEKARNIEDAGGIAMVVANTGIDNAHTGFWYFLYKKSQLFILTLLDFPDRGVVRSLR
jgi:hypothetical protein